MQIHNIIYCYELNAKDFGGNYDWTYVVHSLQTGISCLDTCCSPSLSQGQKISPQGQEVALYLLNTICDPDENPAHVTDSKSAKQLAV